MTQTVTISIDRLRIYARHGVMEQERLVGNMFEVSVSVDYPADTAVATDNIDATVNYAEAIDIIRRVMQQPSALIEHAAGRIRDALTSRWPLIEGGSVRLSKLTPPVGAQVAGGVSVTLRWNKAD